MKVPDDGPKVVGFVVGPSSALYGGLGYGAASTSQHLELNVVQMAMPPLVLWSRMRAARSPL
jgi:hypothetical protein